MAELFQTTPQNITIHLKNIYEEGELEEDATCKDFLQVQNEGSREVERKQKFYNIDAIISVGDRIKSRMANKFRIWATERLKHTFHPTKKGLIKLVYQPFNLLKSAQERTRTFTSVRSLHPECSASTNSATWAITPFKKNVPRTRIELAHRNRYMALNHARLPIPPPGLKEWQKYNKKSLRCKLLLIKNGLQT